MKKSNLKIALIIVAAVVAIVFVCVFIIQGARNKAITLEEEVSSAKSDVNVQEKRRVDLLGNLVDCVKQYDEHEYKTLMETTQQRNINTDADAAEIKTQLNAVAEAYPELKSSDNYKQLMNELSITENSIAAYRENYNKQIKKYNRSVKKFPTEGLLKISGYEVQQYNYLDYGDNSSAPTNLFGE